MTLSKRLLTDQASNISTTTNHSTERPQHTVLRTYGGIPSLPIYHTNTTRPMNREGHDEDNNTPLVVVILITTHISSNPSR